MNRTTGIGLVAGIVLSLSVGGGYYAWREGMIPSSILQPHPLAPLPENFLAALRASPHVAQHLEPACLHLPLRSRRSVDRMGRPGMVHQRLPGWDQLLIAQVPDESRQQIGNLTQVLEVLAVAGYYKASDSETFDEQGGNLPARTYSLTLEGWKHMRDDHCIVAGQPGITRIKTFSRIMSPTDDRVVYETEAEYAVDKSENWVDDPVVSTYLPQDHINKLREPKTARFRLIRTDTGWIVEPGENSAPPLTRETVMELIAKNPLSRKLQACIRLPNRHSLPGFDIGLAPFSATFREMENQGPIDGLFLSELMWQSRFSHLTRAGVFRKENSGAEIGRRYVLDPAYQPWLDMNDADCLRMGKADLEFIDMSVRSLELSRSTEKAISQASVKLMLRLDEDAWIHKLDLSLPEVEAVKEVGGLPVTAQFIWHGGNEDQGWRLVSLQPARNDPQPPRAPRNGDQPTGQARWRSGPMPHEPAPAAPPAARSPRASATTHRSAELWPTNPNGLRPRLPAP